VAGEAKEQVGALRAAADYVRRNFGATPFFRSPLGGPQKSPTELGGELDTLAETLSHGGVVSYQQLDAVIAELNLAGFFLDDDEIWNGIVNAFSPEC
jgi:hypothetical protein